MEQPSVRTEASELLLEKVTAAVRAKPSHSRQTHLLDL